MNGEDPFNAGKEQLGTKAQARVQLNFRQQIPRRSKIFFKQLKVQPKPSKPSENRYQTQQPRSKSPPEKTEPQTTFRKSLNPVVIPMADGDKLQMNHMSKTI